MKPKSEQPTFTCEGKYILTSVEKNAAGLELGHKQKQLEQVEKDRKDRMAAFKSQKDEIIAQISELSNKVTLGYEYRKFRCTRELDFKKKMKIFRDIETDAIIDTRALDPEDYQLEIH